MNKIISTYLTASKTLFKFAYSQTVVVLFLVLTVSELCAEIPNMIVVGGFDKPRHRFFPAYSKDNGESWLDVSNKTQLLVGEPSNTTEIDWTQFIREDSEGRVLVGIARPETKTLTIVQLRVDVAAFR